MQYLLFFLLLTACGQKIQIQTTKQELLSPVIYNPKKEILSKHEIQKYMMTNTNIPFDALREKWHISNIIAIMEEGVDPKKNEIIRYPDSKDEGTNTIMMLATDNYTNLEFIQYLHRKGVPINDSTGSTSLYNAVANRSLNIVKYLIENNAYLYTNTNEFSPLFATYMDFQDCPDITEYLLQRGMPADSLYHGVPALIHHLEYGNYQSAKILLRYGANPVLLPSEYQSYDDVFYSFEKNWNNLNLGRSSKERFKNTADLIYHLKKLTEK